MAHVSLITLGVDDLARATAFYEAIGWERSSASSEGDISFLIGGTVVLGLYGREALGEDARVELPGPPGAVALAMNLPSRAEVDDALATAEAAGARITKPAEPTDWGGYSGYFADPEGHLWEVAHNPGFSLDDDGRVRLA
jgi:uncharacterized protein